MNIIVSEYFPKLRPLRRNVKIQLDLSNYAKKASLKNVTSVDTLKLAKNVELAI